MSNAHNKDGKYRGIIDEIREQPRKMKDIILDDIKKAIKIYMKAFEKFNK